MQTGAERRFPSPLRYPGGKGKIANFFKLLMLHNDLIGASYVEPYAGGAGVALSLLYDEYADNIHINDLNRSVYAFWCAAVCEPDGISKRITDTPLTLDTWSWARAIQADAEPDPIDLAFSTFFLNRTNRSGIINGGIIGGKAQTGAWGMDARFNRADLVRRIQKVARYASRITVTCHDAHELLQALEQTASDRTLVYLDPPYYNKAERLYQHIYAHQDHERIAAQVRKLQCNWVVSYDNAPEVEALYGGLTRIRYDLHYSAAKKQRGSELMYFSDELAAPDVATPANIECPVVERAMLARVASA